MTRAEAVAAELGRYIDAAAHHNLHLAHIRLAALRRLRGLAPYDLAHCDDDCDGDRMFGDDHPVMPRRVAAVVLAAVLAVSLLAGCDPQSTSPNPKPDHKATAAAKPATAAAKACTEVCEPNVGQQPPAPAADPGPYRDIHTVVLKVWWIGERSGSVTVRVNGVARVADDPAGQPRKGADGKYHGGYTRTLTGINKGDDVQLEWWYSVAPTWSMLVIYHNAKIANWTQTGDPDCLKTLRFCGTHAEIR